MLFIHFIWDIQFPEKNCEDLERYCQTTLQAGIQMFLQLSFSNLVETGGSTVSVSSSDRLLQLVRSKKVFSDS